MRPLRVCLVMHSTRSDNLGVGALTASQVVILRRIAHDLGRSIEIIIFDWKDPRQPYVTGPDIRVVDLDRRTIPGFLRTVKGADAVIDIGSGDSFADIYGSRRLKHMFIIKGLVHATRTPLVLAPQTIGPFTNSTSRWLARVTIRWSAIVATRDALSTAAARDLGTKRTIVEASDVALRLPFDPPQPRPAGSLMRAGINVSGLLMGDGYTGRNEFGISFDYPMLIRNLIRLLQDKGAEVHLVPHVLTDHDDRTLREDDYAPSRALAQEFPGTVLAPRFHDPSEAKTYIAALDFFAGARMHACIAAFSSGVPVVPMAYSRKFAGLFGSLGYDHTVDCTKETAEVVLDRVGKAYEDRAVLKADAADGLIRGLAKLTHYENALAELLGRRA